MIQNQTLWFDRRPCRTDLHPDLLALICLLVFFPFLTRSDRILFPKPVSPIFLEIIKLHGLTQKINIDEKQTPFQTNHQNVALSWGGGLDSWAVLKLQPELYHVIIHEDLPEAPLPTDQINYPQIRVLKNNQRQISRNQKGQDAGWITWASVLVSSIWLAEEYQLKMIALGGNLGSVFLKGGAKYYPIHLKPNNWMKTFDLIGIPLYLPLAGLTDLGVLKILGSDLDQVRYCPLTRKTGQNCHECAKCLRKEILIGGQPDPNQNNSSNKLPNTNKNISSFEGPSFKYVLTNDPKLAKWVHKYYQPAFQLIPNINHSLEETLRKRLEKHQIEMIDHQDEYLVEHYGWEL